MFSAAALRVNRAIPRALPLKRVSSLRTSFRNFSTEVPPPPEASSNTFLYTGIGAAALGGAAWYFYTNSDSAQESVQSTKVAANFVPSKGDYQKVRPVRVGALLTVQLLNEIRSTTVLPTF
jgi:cytochrome c peroxidase